MGNGMIDPIDMISFSFVPGLFASHIRPGRHAHELKIDPQYYSDIIFRGKSFEIRNNDRDFRVGDVLVLKEYVNGHYTGKELRAIVTYMTDYAQQKGYVVMAIERMGY
ncbi:DUF3850 domain-containing protein [Lapidilactobacillus luobeiensis]|uniref:DUF3850 domain-containing protein n=1 Tax=Lapidilactobacillus luobeiensis TaxID=2950371 RepID=UPI0021C2BD73|nr:DUF3850 domain-containing protein [Lapidilactobacillus luobeiensis]